MMSPVDTLTEHQPQYNLSILINSLLLCIYIHKPPCTCSVFLFAHSWLMRDPSIVHLDKRWFTHCLCYLELGVLQQLKLLPSPSSKSICCTPCLCVPSWLSRRDISLPSGAWSTATIKVAVRAGNGTYCRPQTVSSHT